ncbi:hypothetical protein J4Q44_G00161650, partial [Coregonus suidteri]
DFLTGRPQVRFSPPLVTYWGPVLLLHPGIPDRWRMPLAHVPWQLFMEPVKPRLQPPSPILHPLTPPLHQPSALHPFTQFPQSRALATHKPQTGL